MIKVCVVIMNRKQLRSDSRPIGKFTATLAKGTKPRFFKGPEAFSDFKTTISFQEDTKPKETFTFIQLASAKAMLRRIVEKKLIRTLSPMNE